MDESAVGIDDLEDLPLFAGLDGDDLEAILRTGHPASFKAGETLVERGDPGDAMYIVLSGTAEVVVGGRSHRITKGDFLGEMAVLAGKKRMATVTAVEDVEALQVSAEHFQTLLLERPRIALAIIKSMVERLREAQDRIDAWIGVW